MDKMTTIPAALLAVGKVTARCVAIAKPENGFPEDSRITAETVLAIIRQCEPKPAGDGLPVSAESFPEVPTMNGEVERIIAAARALVDRIGCGAVIAPGVRSAVMADADALRESLRAVGG